jgi:predicted ATPase/class 3 adenylate cyclase
VRSIAEWLADLGLGEYAQHFAENDIDLSILPDLSDPDLKELGVSSLGHRRKILRAISELGGARPAADSAVAPPAPASSPAQISSPQAPLPPALEAAGERRYLTVMFCDLVGSTGISAQLDAEEWRDLVGAYLDAASAAVTEMDGYVAKKLGDGILALFGYPLAHENDAERAARAALAIQRALTDLNRKNAGSGKPELQARIGLDTGPAVIDAAGEIYGDVANIAARVQAQAEPGAVLITAHVQRQVAGLFVAEERGAHALKGIPEPTALFKLVRASGGGRRAGPRNLTPLVGRDDEMTMLLRRWERARAGDGQLVLIVGEPGLGKSRLIEEFRARLSDIPHTWVEWSCSQLLQNTPLHPIAEWGRQRFGGADLPAERRLAELESSLAQVKLDPAETAPLLAPLLDIPLPAERVSKLLGEELRRRQLAALTTWVMAGAKVQPVVLAFEDLHWADPTSLDVLKVIAEQGALAPLFIVTTTRPEFRPPWATRSHHGTISLVPLDRAQVRDMVTELSARHALSRDVIEGVAARTGGVPLFVEEVTRLLLEGGGQGGIQSIPPTLQQSLMARLDRLGPAREVAQIGSVIGRGFSYRLLRDVGGMEDTPLQAALDKLADADIVLAQGLPPQSDYRFKHALIQDAAYENLLKSRRQVLHRRVAEILRDRFADTAAAEPEVLAHHFTQAGMTDAAIEWWGKAGDQALRRSAFQEAIAHLGKAIEMADKDGDGAPRAPAAAASTSASERLKLQTSLGRAVMWSKGYAAPETAAAFARAEDLGVGGEGTSERFVTYYGQFAVRLWSGDVSAARQIAANMLRDAGADSQTPEAFAAHRIMACVTLSQGNLADAKTHSEKALKIDDSGWDRDANLRFGHDSRVAAMDYFALANWQLGDPQTAHEVMDSALAAAREAGHVPTLAFIHFNAALLNCFGGDADAVRHHAGALVQLSREHQLSLWQAMASVLRGWACARLGDRESGLEELARALDAHRGQGNKFLLPLFQGLRAEQEGEGQIANLALTRVDEALALAAETGEHWTDALLHRIRGEILLKRDPANTAPAEEAFLTAIAIAQQQKARSFELRAALSLAKLYQSTNRAADAHAVLAPALEGFSPTPEFPEIEQARTLLATLANTDDVKNAAASRQRRLKLQTDYGQALMWSRGYTSEEAKAAFARAQELAGTADDPSERFATYYGQWSGYLMRGQLNLARETAAAFLRDAENGGRPTETAVASRVHGATCLYLGDLVGARKCLEEALRIYDPERDSDAKFRFAVDVGAVATVHLALVYWLLGRVDRAAELANEAIARAREIGHMPTETHVEGRRAILPILRGDAEAVLRVADPLLELTQQHGLSSYVRAATLSSTWAHAQLGAGKESVAEFRQAIAAYADQANRLYLPFYQGLLAELEGERQSQDEALTRVDDALSLAQQTEECWSDAFLHRIRAEILLKRDPGNTAPAEEAFITAITIAQQQKAKSFELQAALSLAKVYQSTNRAADAHAVLAPALEGFSPTPEFPEIGEAQALLAALAETDEVKNAAASRQRRIKLQTGYAQAMLWSRGFSAEETQAAYTRAQQLAAGAADPTERFVAYYGLWIGNLTRGELALSRQTAEAFVREANTSGSSVEHAIASRNLGISCLVEGRLTEARANLLQVSEARGTAQDQEVRERFGIDVQISASVYLAVACWLLGEIERSRALMTDAIRRASDVGHIPTLTMTHLWNGFVQTFIGNAQAAQASSAAVLDLSREHNIAYFRQLGALVGGWALGKLGDLAEGTTTLRNALAQFAESGNRLSAPLFQGGLAQLELERGEIATALASLDTALALANQTAEHYTDAFLHRIRGEILLKRDPGNTAPAEEAFITAITIAQQQKAKSFELQAALSLAKVYQSTNRAADAHAVLAPALEGFSPTPEFPEIGEAQALAETDEVKNAAASRQRRLKLQTSYGQAVMLSRGYGSEESEAAFARAKELAAGSGNVVERHATLYGNLMVNLSRGEIKLAQAAAENLSREAEKSGLVTEATVGRRMLGNALLYQGDFIEAHKHLELAVSLYDPARDRDAKFRFSVDPGAGSAIFLAHASWALGDIERARKLVQEAVAQAVKCDHIPTLAYVHHIEAIFEIIRGDAAATRQAAETLVEISRKHDLALFLADGTASLGWARARLGDRPAGAIEIREGLAAKADLGSKLNVPLFAGLLAEIESEGGDLELGLTTINESLALASETAEHRGDALLHRVRGEILLKRDPGNTAPAEEAFITAITIAQQQKAKSFELRAALSLAKLYQSTDRAADAHAVLAPALEGFSPTPEFPEIEQAQTLMSTLAK